MSSYFFFGQTKRHPLIIFYIHKVFENLSRRFVFIKPVENKLSNEKDTERAVQFTYTCKIPVLKKRRTHPRFLNF